MSDSRYSPPAARVEDSSPPQEPVGQRPSQIVLVVRLAAINYVLGLIVMALAWGYYSSLGSVTATVISQLFGLALLIWLYYKIYVGRNWARITLLVLSIISIPLSLNPLVTNLLVAAPVIVKVQMFVSLAISVVILWLLFLSPGKEWFRKARRS